VENAFSATVLIEFGKTKLVSAGVPEKQFDPNVSTLGGIVISLSFIQRLNIAAFSIVTFIPSPNITVVKLIHVLKQPIPISVTVFGIVIVSKLVQIPNTPSFNFVRVFGRFTDCNCLHRANANVCISLNVSGKFTLDNDVQL
jgi:hypothetical protein